jgi:hypothetical protein
MLHATGMLCLSSRDNTAHVGCMFGNACYSVFPRLIVVDCRAQQHENRHKHVDPFMNRGIENGTNVLQYRTGDGFECNALVNSQFAPVIAAHKSAYLEASL